MRPAAAWCLARVSSVLGRILLVSPQCPDTCHWYTAPLTDYNRLKIFPSSRYTEPFNKPMAQYTKLNTSHVAASTWIWRKRSVSFSSLIQYWISMSRNYLLHKIIWTFQMLTCSSYYHSFFFFLTISNRQKLTFLLFLEPENRFKNFYFGLVIM